jgi:hypothetical protein
MVTPAKRTKPQTQIQKRGRKGTAPPAILTANLTRKKDQLEKALQSGSTTPKRFGDKNFATIHIPESPTTARARPSLRVSTSNLPSSTRYTAAER